MRIWFIQYENQPKISIVVRDIDEMAVTRLSTATPENVVPAFTRVVVFERNDMYVAQPVALSVH